MTAPEEWRPVPGLPGVEASSEGRVRRNGVLLALVRHAAYGYHRVFIGKRGHLAHRLVCLAFHGPAPEGRPIVAHHDGDKFHNRPGNLRWASHAENGRDSVRLGERASCRKLSDDDILAIRAMRAEGAKLTQIGARFGARPSASRWSCSAGGFAPSRLRSSLRLPALT